MARKFCRKMNITAKTSATASNSVFTTSVSESVMKGSVSSG